MDNQHLNRNHFLAENDTANAIYKALQGLSFYNTEFDNSSRIHKTMSFNQRKPLPFVNSDSSIHRSGSTFTNEIIIQFDVRNENKTGVIWYFEWQEDLSNANRTGIYHKLQTLMKDHSAIEMHILTQSKPEQYYQPQIEQ